MHCELGWCGCSKINEKVQGFSAVTFEVQDGQHEVAKNSKNDVRFRCVRYQPLVHVHDDKHVVMKYALEEPPWPG